MQDDNRFDQPAGFLSLFGFFYGVSVSSWLHPLLKRPSRNRFTQAFQEHFGTFLDEHELRLVENSGFENMLQLWVNVKYATFRSPQLTLRFTYLVDHLKVSFRDGSSRESWRDLFQLIPNANPDKVLILEHGAVKASYVHVLGFIDDNWLHLVKTVEQHSQFNIEDKH